MTRPYENHSDARAPRWGESETPTHRAVPLSAVVIETPPTTDPSELRAAMRNVLERWGHVGLDASEALLYRSAEVLADALAAQEGETP